MAEESSQESHVKVRDLINAFEKKSTTTLQRPRAHSMGDVLSPDVFVRSTSFNSLETIESDLQTIQKEIEEYQVYKKELHVALQDQIFSLLVKIQTSGGDEEITRYLVSSTQKLLARLSTKLPSSSSTSNEDKYVPYKDYKKSSKKAPSRIAHSKSFTETKGGKRYKSELSLSPSAAEAGAASAQPPAVSVSKLRNLFESKEKSLLEGIGVVTRPETNNFKFRVNMPYNANRQPVRTFQNSRGMRTFLAKSRQEKTVADDDGKIFIEETRVVTVGTSGEIEEEPSGGIRSASSDSESAESVESVKEVGNAEATEF